MRHSIVVAVSISVFFLAGCVENTEPNGFLGLERKPSAGYEWLSPDSLFDYSVVWTPGFTSDNIPHLTASEKQDEWQADLGYDIVEDTSSEIGIAASWRPGTRWQDAPHMTTAAQQDTWEPDPGYDIITTDQTAVGLLAVWRPGKAHSTMPHVIAGQNEGVWTVEEGYQWLNADAGDLRVTLVQTEDDDPFSYENLGRPLIHEVAKSCATPEEDDGFFASVGRLGCLVTAVATYK